MDAFVEACFVWFGLWAFWNLASDVREFDGDEVEKLLQRARQGFLGGALTNLIGEQRTMVTSDTLEAIALMQTTVRFEQL
jgi:hypothetical protein